MSVLVKNRSANQHSILPLTALAKRPGEVPRAKLQHASAPVLEMMEQRVLFSTIAAWDFNSLTVAVNTTPAPSVGSGTASSVGMSSTSAGGAYPSANATGTQDKSAISAPSGASSDGGTGAIWKVVGNNGWNHSAGIASQGAQFLVNTTSYTGVSLQFDWGTSSSSANGQLAVEYTLNANASTPTWTVAPTSALSIGSNSASTVSINTNSASANTISGSYFKDNQSASNAWLNGLTVDFSSITGASNNPNFGVRLVNAATGADVQGAGSTALPSDSSGNWRLDEIKILGNLSGSPTAPAITLSPASVTTPAGVAVTLKSTATGNPAPTVQWYQGTVGSGSIISGATSPNYTLTPSAVGSNQYYAVYHNSAGTDATTSAATVTAVAAVITTQPTDQFVAAGGSVTFTSVASAASTAGTTVQWQSSTGAAYTNITATSTTTVAGVTTTKYTFVPTEAQTGMTFKVIYTDSFGTVTSSVATLTVMGTPITQWNFTSGLAPTPGGSLALGTGNNPYASLQNSSGDSATTIGLNNNYTGIQAVPESDILPNRSTINPNFNEYVWRVRSGNGTGPTGSPGTPEGWSQYAPALQSTTVNGVTYDPQGVVFKVSTAGYNNVTLHFDWNGGGIADMQPEYTSDITAANPVWTVLGTPIEASTKDYYGITSSTNPTGILVNLQGVSAANDNPNFGLRLVAAYNPNLPSITDGNLINPVVHQQFAAAGFGPQNAIQTITLGGGITGAAGNGTFKLTFKGVQTAAISYNPADTLANRNANAAAIAAALGQISSIGSANNVSVIPIDDTNTRFSVTFVGSLQNAPQTLMTVDASGLTGSSPTGTVETWVNGTSSATGVTRYVDGGGAWQIGNISFNGDNVLSRPGVITNPISQSIPASISDTVVLSSSAYSDSPITGVVWQMNSGSGWTTAPGTITGTTSNSIFTFTRTPANSEIGTSIQYRAEFTNSAGATDSAPATITVVSPVSPVVTVQPNNVSVVTGGTVILTASATGNPAPAVQWKFNDGTGWQNVVLSTSTTVTTIVTGQTTATTLSLVSSSGLTGYQYEAVFTNAVSAVTSNTITLNVLQSQHIITDWNFNNFNTSGTAAYTNNPAPTIGAGTAKAIGFDLPYNYQDPATGDGLNSFGSVNSDDVVSTPSAVTPTFSENTWRIRGGINATSGGTPSNGWSNFAPQYTQGAEFDVSTVGYGHIYVTLDWYSTTSGILDAQEQYSTDITNPNSWTNLGPSIQAFSNDFYGAGQGANGTPIPLVIDVSSIAGASNNPNFGVRLVSAYNPVLTAANGGVGLYANAALVGSPAGPAVYNGSKGNWRFANIIVQGVATNPVWLSPTAISSGAATWNTTTQTLTVTGSTSIIADPAASGDSPLIVVTGAGNLAINPASGRTINIGGLTLNGGGVASLTSSTTTDILIVAPGGPFSIGSGSKLDLGKNFLDIKASNSSQGAAALSNIAGLISTAYSGGTWTGSGLTSSAAQSDASHLTALGYLYNNGIYGSSGALGTFDTTNPGVNDVLVRDTYYGDTNLDGKVDGSDYSNIDAAFIAQTAFAWSNGNLNFDSAINGSDYTLMDNAYNTQGAQLAASAAQISQTTKRTFASGAVIANPAVTLADNLVLSTSDILKKAKQPSWASQVIEEVAV